MKLLFPPCFPSSPLWREVTASSPHPGSGDYALSAGQSIRINYLEFCCAGGSSPLHTYIFLPVWAVCVLYFGLTLGAAVLCCSGCSGCGHRALIQVAPVSLQPAPPTPTPDHTVCVSTSLEGSRGISRFSRSPCSFDWRTALETKI